MLVALNNREYFIRVDRSFVAHNTNVGGVYNYGILVLKMSLIFFL